MPVKQVIVIRKDLKMRRGKEIAQGSHASMKFMAHLIAESISDGKPVQLNAVQTEWLGGLFTKVCLQAKDEQELMDVYREALRAGLDAHDIIDAGLTEFKGIPTRTCIAIGPDEADKIDAITGKLPLY